MIVAVIALVVAASGTAVAATQLVNGDSLIKKNSLSGNRLRNRSVQGSKIKVSSLGTVPSAKTASTAATAATATTATTAGSAAISKVTNVATTAPIDTTNSPNGVLVSAACPAGNIVLGGGASFSNVNNDFVTNSAPVTHFGWSALFFGGPGDTGTVTAICAPAAAVAP